MNPKPRIAFKTLGCRLNQFETDALASQFNNENYDIVDFAKPADIYVVNTCTVTNQGDAKSRKAVNQAIRSGNEPVVVVTGCMVNAQREKLQKMNGVTYFVENARKSSIYQIVDAHLKGETVDPDTLEGNLFNFQPADATFHTRSYLKIQDGCDNFCTFCIVPRVRGRAVSRPVNDILDHARKLVDLGFREMVITGVNLGRYNHENTNFEDLVEKIIELPGDFRVRISSIEPEGFGDKLFNLFEHPKLMPHLHLCLQSGSDRILLKMRRFYNVSTFMGMISKVKSKYPLFNITTDIIVGFPGETAEDFNESCRIAEDAGFSHIHTFKYSVREGTRAARMEEQVPEKVKNERSRLIRDISVANKRKYRTRLLGVEQKVLVERVDPQSGFARGYGDYYVPVAFRGGEEAKNRFFNVRPASLGKGDDPVLLG
jgi:threonylcarbamoyladenosine tRNA methylthiotransferase MtaB